MRRGSSLLCLEIQTRSDHAHRSRVRIAGVISRSECAARLIKAFANNEGKSADFMWHCQCVPWLKFTSHETVLCSAAKTYFARALPTIISIRCYQTSVVRNHGFSRVLRGLVSLCRSLQVASYKEQTFSSPSSGASCRFFTRTCPYISP